MSTVSLSVVCAKCSDADVECELSIESYGSSGSYWEPGEGAEWSVITATCTECGHDQTEPELEEAYGQEIQRRIAEHDEPATDL